MMFHDSLKLRFCLLSSITLLSLASNANGQQVFLSSPSAEGLPIGPIIPYGQNNWIGGSQLPNNSAQLLHMPQIAEELGLDEEQSSTINDLSKAMRQQVSEVMKNIDFGEGDAGKIMQEAQRNIRERAEEKLEEVLTPQQLDRLKQIKVQASLKSRGALALLTGDLSDYIRLTDKQQNTLRQVHAAKQAELREEIRKLRERYLEETVEKVLDSKQQKKFKELVGEVYKVKPRNVQPAFAPSAVPTKRIAKPKPSRD